MKKLLKIRFLTLLLAFLAFPLLLNAQFTRLTTINAGDILCLTRAEGKIYAGTNGSGVYVSTDNGTNWTEINTGLPYGLAVSTIYFNDGKLYVGATTSGVTELPKIYNTSTTQYNWSLIDNKGINTTATKFSAMYKYKDTLYLGTDKGLFRAAASGSVSTWTNFANGIGSAIVVQTFAHDTTNNLLYLGTKTVGAYLYKDGKAFQKITGNPSPNLNVDVRSLIVSGNKMYAGTGAGVWLTQLTSDGTVAWTKLSADVTNCLTIASNGVYAGTDSKGVQTLSTGGNVFAPTTDWSLSKSPDKKVQCIVSAGNQVLAGTSLSIFKTTDMGNTWNFSISGISNLTILEGYSEMLITRLNNVLYLGTNKGLFKSADEGITWQIVPIIAVNATTANITTVSSNNSVLYAAISTIGLFRSFDFGLSWSICANFPDATDKIWNCMAYYNNAIFVGGGKGIYKSTNGGDSWGSMMQGFDIDSTGGGARNLTVYNNQLYYAGIKGIHKTNLNVIDWQDISPMFTDRDYRGIYFINGKMFVASRWYGCLVSENEGITYSYNNGDMQSTTPFAFVGDGTNMVYKGLNPIISYLSSDSGKSWRTANAEILGATNAKWLIGGGKVFAVSNNVVYMRNMTTPLADFNVSNRSIEANNSVTFNDLTSASQSGWKWEFPGGVPAVSYLKNPTVMYPQPGVYGVTLTTTNASGSAKITKHNYITVLGNQSWLPTQGIAGAFLPDLYSQKKPTDIQSIYNFTTDSKSTIYKIESYGNKIVISSDIGIFVSTDNGTTWLKKNKSVTSDITDLPIPAKATVLRNDSIITATPRGVYLSKDNGVTWIEKGIGLIDKDIVQLKQKGNILYALSSAGNLFSSDVSNFSWSKVPTLGLNNSLSILLPIKSIHISASGLWAGTVADNGGGIYSFNNGSWSKMYSMSNSIKYISSFVEGGGKMYGSVGSEATFYEGVLVSSNGGKTWSQMPNTGIQNLSIEDVAFVNNKVFATTPNGLFSINATAPVSWTKVNVSTEFFTNDVGEIATLGNEMYVVATGGIYASSDGSTFVKRNGIGAGALPSRSEIFAMKAKGSTVFASVRNQGVFVSTDEGNTWTMKNNGLNNNPILTFFVDGNTVYAGAKSAVFKTIDNGDTWSYLLDVTTTIAPNIEVRTIAKYNGELYVGTNGDGLYKFNGSTWTKMGLPLQTNDKITALLVKDSYLFVAIYVNESVNQGIFRYDGTSMISKSVGMYTADIKAMTVSNNIIWAAASHEDLGIGGGRGNGIHISNGAKPYETLYYSDNNGDSWIPVTENMQKARAGMAYYAKATDVLAVGGGVLVATQNGVYFADNKTKTMYLGNVGLPKLSYNNFWDGEPISKFANTGNNILAGTGGFGVFKYPNYVDFSSTVAMGSFAETGQIVKLFDKSTFEATTWTWSISPSAGVSFQNATNANSQNPEIIFTNIGVYTFSLTVSNGSVIKNVIKNNFITVKSPTTYILNIEKSGNGSFSPATATVHNSGTLVTIIATPETNNIVKGIFVNGVKQSGTSVQVTMDSDKKVSIQFSPNTLHTLTIINTPGGTVAQSGTGTYIYDDYAQLTATPQFPNSFKYWLINGVSYFQNPIDILIQENISVTAVFSTKVFTVKINPSNKIPDAIFVGGTSTPAPGIYSFNEGTNVKISAVNSQHYSFGEWRINGSNTSTDATLNLLVDANKELELDFNLNTYKVTMEKDNDVVSFNALSYTRVPMQTVKLQAFFPQNYAFMYWQIGNITVTENPYILTVEKSVTAKAFVQVQVSISEKTLSDYNIYPNPAKTILNIRNAEDLKQVEITNISGQVIKIVNVEESNIALSVADLRNGFYILKLVNKNGKVLQTKFMKE